MTVLIGLRCEDGAVLASDSQETRASYFRYWSKDRLIANQFVALSAGSPTIGEVFSRRLTTKFLATQRESKIDRLKACQLIEETLLSLAKEAGEDAVKGRQILIAGVTDLGEVCLWAIDSDEIYLREMRTWECYGTGIDAAEMLLKDFHFSGITTTEAIPLLAYVIGAVCDICIDCGGPISIVVVTKDGLKQLSRETIEASLNKVKPLLDKLRKELPKNVLKGQLHEDQIKILER